MTLFAIVVGLVLYGLAAPDRATLGLTRGAAGAVRASIGSGGRTRSATRSTRPDRTQSGRSHAPIQSTRPRSGGRSTRSMKPHPTRPDRVGPRSPSRIARAIDGWIDGADGATQRRGEAAAALRRLRDRTRDRKAAKQRAAAEPEAWAENARRDRAEQRARSSEAAQEIATQYDPPAPPAPPATPNGAPVSDLRHIPLTELDHMTAAQAEAGAAYLLTEQIREGVLELNNWVGLFPERFRGATDLLKTGQMEASVALLGEVGLYNIEAQLAELHGQLEVFMRAMLAAQKDAQESDAKTGRVETAIPN